MRPRLVPIETQKPRLIPIKTQKPRLVPIEARKPKLVPIPAKPRKPGFYAMPELTIGEKIKKTITKPFRLTFQQKRARLNIALDIKRKSGIPLEAIQRDFEGISRKYARDYLGVATEPTTKEMISAGLALPITTALMANPIGVTLGIAGFMGLSEVESGLVSFLQKSPYRPLQQKGISSLLPDEANKFTKDTVDILSFIGKGLVAKGIYKKAPGAYQKITKQFIEKYNLPKEVYVSPKEIESVFKTQADISPYKADLVKTIGKGQWRTALKKGVTIKVPAEKVITISDKPYFSRIKNLFNLKPYKEVRITQAGEPVATPIRRYLPAPEKIIPPEPIVKPPVKPEIKPPEVKPSLEAIKQAKDKMKPKVKVIKPPSGKITILPRKEQLLKQIDEAIKKAPDIDPTILNTETFDRVSFKIDGGAKILNTKKSLTEFQSRIKKTAPFMGIEAKKRAVLRPKGIETFEKQLARAEKKGEPKEIEEAKYNLEQAKKMFAKPPKEKAIQEYAKTAKERIEKFKAEVSIKPAAPELEGLAKEAGKRKPKDTIENISKAYYALKFKLQKAGEGYYSLKLFRLKLSFEEKLKQHPLKVLNARVVDSKLLPGQEEILVHTNREMTGGEYKKFMEEVKNILPVQKTEWGDKPAGKSFFSLLEPLEDGTFEIRFDLNLAKKIAKKMGLDIDFNRKLVNILNNMKKSTQPAAPALMRPAGVMSALEKAGVVRGVPKELEPIKDILGKMSKLKRVPHFIGDKEGFPSDKEFDPLRKILGGKLPKDFPIWEYADEELYKISLGDKKLINEFVATSKKILGEKPDISGEIEKTAKDIYQKTKDYYKNQIGYSEREIEKIATDSYKRAKAELTTVKPAAQKEAPKELEGLAKEARKYKEVEDFEKALYTKQKEYMSKLYEESDKLDEIPFLIEGTEKAAKQNSQIVSRAQKLRKDANREKNILLKIAQGKYKGQSIQDFWKKAQPPEVKRVEPKGLAKVAGEPEVIEKERITKPKEILIEEKIVQEGRPCPIAEYGEKIYQDYIDRFASIANITKKAQKLGVKIKPGENPGIRAREYLGMGRKVETMLKKSTYRITPEGKEEITGEGLKPILDDIGKKGIKEKDLNSYLKAMRVVEDLQRPKDEWTVEQIATPKQVIESRKTLENLSPNQNFKEIADRLYGFQQRVLHLLVDSGQLSEEGYQQIIKLNPHYVPFDRILKGADVGLVTAKRRFTGARTPIKRIKGSELETYNPLESIIKNTYKIMDVTERNVVVGTLSKLQEVFPDEVTPKEIKMVPVAVVEHKAAIDADFQRKLVDFAKTLGAKFKTTGQIGRVLGTYYPSGKRITRKFATPREIISHETAHFFDDKFKLKQRFYKRLAPIKGEGLWGKKKPVTEELIGLMRRMGETVGRIAKPAERFADGFEWWLTHRDLAAKEIPLFSKEMANIIREIPELSPILNIKPTPKVDVEVMKETIFRPSQFKPKGNVLEYFENGDRKYIEVTPNLYQAMTGLNEVSASLMVKILSKPAHWLRVGATITPEFMLRNPLRDQLTALFQTKIGFIPGIDTAGAIADVVGETEVYHQWLRSGGAYSGFVELSRPQLQKSLKELTRPLSKKLLRKLNIITTAQDLSQLFEQATRVAVFKKAIKKMTLVEAGFLSREATVDFGRKGSQLKDINQMVAFLNAGIQGVDKSIRNTIKNPAGMSAKAIATITIPALLLYLRNRKDPDFKEIPRWQRDLFFVTKIGNIYIRIPKPFLYGQVFGSIPERFFEYLDTKDKSAFDNLSRSIYDSLLPVSGDPVGGLLATAIKPLIENRNNWNFFLERNIVPEGRKRLLPEEQYQKYTTKTAKEISKGMGKVKKIPLLKQIIDFTGIDTPAKLENLIRGWFGGTGGYALEAGDVLIKGIKKARGEKIEPGRPTELTDIPLIKGFVTRPAYSGTSESIQNFYESSKKANAAYLTYRKLIKEGRRTEAIQIRKNHPEWKYAKILNKYSSTLSAYTNIIDRTIKSSTLSVEEKRRKIKSLEKKRVIVARKANEFLRKKK